MYAFCVKYLDTDKGETETELSLFHETLIDKSI